MLPDRMETARLRLRVPVAGDVDAIFAYAVDPRVCRFLAWPCHKSKADTRAFLEMVLKGWSEGTDAVWLIEDGEGVIGTIGAVMQPAGAGLGYALAHRVWGRGYATEVLAAVAGGLEEAGIKRLLALCLPENEASARVLEKCGFRRDRVLRRYFSAPNLGGGKRDTQLYIRCSST